MNSKNVKLKIKTMFGTYKGILVSMSGAYHIQTAKKEILEIPENYIISMEVIA